MSRRIVTVEELGPAGESGFYRSSISYADHGDAIQVTGKNLHECIERTMEIVTALNTVKQAKP